ncbi:dehydrogenase [Pseudomonas sp. PIC25]|uniref:YciI family protein n=1 Tax=Pseudomonas sp. PIC25 TaxID=1958773 RepID=UPI000BAB9ED1|nr:YciI family protein [Pseudomonas sp. PIC25]PAU64999.1 dehydrogenase [Pseudomonas sp. PIC25]
MKYLCLIYCDEDALDAMPAREREALTERCMAYSDELGASGRYLGGERLQPVQMARTLRIRQDGSLNITDGPFAETKEQLAGFYLIDARDLNEAIQVAAKIPPASLGSVEVRPVRDLPQH